jgi:hypothetical protein
MIAVDTNLFVRYLTGNQPVQPQLASAVIDGEDILILTTVILKRNGCCGASRGYRPKTLLGALRAFASCRSHGRRSRRRRPGARSVDFPIGSLRQGTYADGAH